MNTNARLDELLRARNTNIFQFSKDSGIPFKLKSTFDFSFMKEYGTVFKVYDDQDSGNICFGTEKDEKIDVRIHNY